ncbi:MAG: hypothetical protein GY804_05335 [Alphaproteobacteria bacterium]|nr:hypothetical protein [Alphaproteobacteria bacterium]
MILIGSGAFNEAPDGFGGGHTVAEYNVPDVSKRAKWEKLKDRGRHGIQSIIPTLEHSR